MKTEHGIWTNPDGSDAAPDDYAGEETEPAAPTTRDLLLAELAALHRMHRAGPAMLKALRNIVALDSDPHPGLATWQEARAHAHREAIEAIAITEPPQQNNNEA